MGALARIGQVTRALARIELQSEGLEYMLGLGGIAVLKGKKRPQLPIGMVGRSTRRT